ncbi:Holliday junction ATP-dependent DNA helicase RuvB [BD1-7 clade bacterium]|uniref:Holliday junction ATP-dependent DNA helicase RuvB n=1 Tax=BD1-7 clade bacterium TaxID=2029982 RepID=A0A5S9P613_9GAMM|nr:Holliday junction ATP-dependent DNA helicase RuvB [BD1-7 clade bacterium]
MANGTFGLKDEAEIIKSGVREVFTPHIPVDDVSHFFGREDEASRLVSVINSPGQHILLYGDRGVGKTSLAKTTCKVILQKIQKGEFFEKRCDSDDSFASIFEEPLEKCGIDLSFKEETKTLSQGGDAGINAGFAKAGVKSNRQTKETKVSSYKPDSPSWVADKLKKLSGIMLIDEADAISEKSDKKKMAELIKLLSDSNSPFKIVIVGIAETGEELTAGHPSVERCLKEVLLQRMTDDDLKKIILNGMKKLGLRPDESVVEKIVDISAGYPHFTHLVSLKCAEAAIIGKNKHITKDTLKGALEEAVKDSEGALQRMLESTLRVLNKPQEYKFLLLTASYCSAPEFRSAELRDKLKDKFGIDIESKALSRRLTKLTESNKLTILEKPARGCFKFSDPRMPSFLKMALNSDDNEI